MQSIRKKSFAAEQLAKRQKKSPATIAIIVIAVIIAVGAVGYALYMHFGAKEVPTETDVPPKEPIKSIAVLPFRDMSPDNDQDWFCEGVADRILNNLSNIRNLKKYQDALHHFYLKVQMLTFLKLGNNLMSNQY